MLLIEIHAGISDILASVGSNGLLCALRNNPFGERLRSQDTMPAPPAFKGPKEWE
jgi:hypothetical protein